MESVSSIKRAQKESLFLRVISKLFIEAAMDDPELQKVFITRVALSKDKSTCFVYFSSHFGKEQFKKTLQQLKLYKPSLRKALSREIPGKRTPQLIFKYDEQLEKQLKLENLIEKAKPE